MNENIEPVPVRYPEHAFLWGEEVVDDLHIGERLEDREEMMDI